MWEQIGRICDPLQFELLEVGQVNGFATPIAEFDVVEGQRLQCSMIAFQKGDKFPTLNVPGVPEFEVEGGQTDDPAG